ncbi:MAG TPA: GNAT family N-acetyltransferase [Propionibacteriaceae bacterium]|nr:GNAT family N-acetyltransferase [Propionibacteriaceae bacterium]
MAESMTPSPTAPHLAKRDLVYLTPERLDEFFAAVVHGFHDDYVAANWEPNRKVFEPERTFGFQVDGRWVSTCGAYSRRLTVPGGTVPTAAVTVVTVQPSYRRRGLLTEMMKHQLDDIHERGEEPVALLWASESAIYGRFGYGQACPQVRLSGKTKTTGFRPDVDLGSGSVGEVEHDQAIPIIKRLHNDLLPRRVGALNRSDDWWAVRWHDPEQWRHGASGYRFALHYDHSGQPDGYVAFRVKNDWSEGGAEVSVSELDADKAEARAALWRFVLDLDLVRRFVRHNAPLDDSVRYLVADLRSVKAEDQDGTYARLVDVPRALEARRYLADLDVTIRIEDPLLDYNTGTIRLEAGRDGASVTRVTRGRRRPDLAMNIRDLSAMYLGGTSLAALVRAGLVSERTKGAAAATGAAFAWSQPPFCPDFF